jgi:hypothetical protein
MSTLGFGSSRKKALARPGPRLRTVSLGLLTNATSGMIFKLSSNRNNKK